MATAGEPAAARLAHALRPQAVSAPLGSSLLVAVLIVGVAYYIGAWIGISTAFPGPGDAKRNIFWPPNVILFAALLAAPPRWWWAYILTTFAAHLLVHAQLGVAPAVMALPVQFAGNVLQAAVAALILRRVNDPPWRVDTLRSMIMVIAVAGVAAPALVSALVIRVYVWVGWMSDYESAWRVRFLANAVSTITLAPLLLTVAGQWPWAVRAGALRRAPEFAALLAGLLVVDALASRSATSSAELLQLYAPLPFLLWAAVRFESPGLGVALAVTLLLFVGQTFEGPRLGLVPTDNTIGLTVFLVAIAIPLQLLAALIHERRLAEERIAETQQRYRLATVAGDVSVWDWDVATGRLRVDSMLKGALGYADHEIPDTIEAWRAHVPPSDVARMCAAAQAHLDGVTTHCEVEHQMLHKDGSVRWFHARGAVSTRCEGKASRMSGTEVDITARKTAEARAEADRAVLRHMSRVSTMGQLSAAIAHQLNQPLAAILGNAETAGKMLGREPVDTQELREILDDIVSEDHRAAEIIRRLGALYKRGEMEMSAVDLNELVRETLDLVRGELTMRHVTTATEFAPSLPRLNAGRIQLQQVLLNFVLNAADAMSGVDDAERMITIRTEVDGGNIVLRVSDRGTGIAPADLERVFDPFWSTKSTGVGVGLAICHAIITAHRGTLTAANNPDGGAVFCATLPAQG